MTPDNIRQQILDHANILCIISDYIPDLKRKGQNYVCNCPFHDERTGSFSVSETKQIFKCFGCDAGGNVIDFVIKYLNVDYSEAIRIIANKSGIILDEKSGYKKPEAKMSPAAPQDEFTFVKKEFTKYELSLLGPKVTAEHCAQFNLVSVASYIMPKNKDGKSWQIESTDDFPIFIYEYDDWGKVYQPLSDDYRFSYYGNKPDDFIFGDKKTLELINKARGGQIPSAQPAHIDINASELVETDNGKLPNLIICSGGSDALNLYATGKYHVCYLNSENAVLSNFEYTKLLKPIVEDGQLYVLYDLDKTGIRRAYELGLQFIDLKIVLLPEDLKKFRDAKGKQCKDVKDFFMRYKNPRHRNLIYLLDNIIKTSLPLQFWSITYDKDLNPKGYDINNEQLYGFLAALGIYTLPNEQSKKGFIYVHIQDNIVREIKEDGLQSYVNMQMIGFLKENLQHYNISLINTIHRSNQAKLSSLEKIRRTEINFRSYSAEFDHVFFQNTAVKVSAKGIEAVKMQNSDLYVFESSKPEESKIIKHDYRKQDAPFQIEYTPEYLQVKNAFESLSKTDPGYKEAAKEFNKFDPLKRFKLNITDNQLSVIRYIYNTGRVNWKKEEAGIPLTEEERAEHDLHFINKVMAIGYLMFRHKDKSRAYMVYAMETELSDVGKHKGGTGKSMFFLLLEFLRTMLTIDGQLMKKDDDETMFTGTRKGVTDSVYIDDLNKNIDMHRLMPAITGKMTVRNLYENKIIIPFEDSPKLAVSSNHSLSSFDNSLRRRVWFLGFSDYYHSEDLPAGLTERSPRSEFGCNIPDDYNETDMNRFYNFMLYCLHTYIKFSVRVNPPMESIERRITQRELGDEFIWWADEYFNEKRLNIDIDKAEAFEAWKIACISPAFHDKARSATLKSKLAEYCRYKKYSFNPADLLVNATETEKARGEKRAYVDGKDIYYWHIRTTNKEDDNNEVEF